VSDRLRRFTAVSSTLHVARSYKHQGRDLAARGEAGQGEGCCAAAQALLRDALAVAEVREGGGGGVPGVCWCGVGWGLRMAAIFAVEGVRLPPPPPPPRPPPLPPLPR
jgi:hypothetical protein